MVDYLSSDEFDRRGYELLERGKFEEAVDYFKDALELCPYNADLYAGLGQAYGELGEYVFAARAFSEGLKLSPNDDEMLLGLGLCYLKLNRLKDARSCFEHVEDRSMRDPEVLFNLALGYFQVECPDDAVEYCQKALEMEPDHADCLALLAICYHETGEEPELVFSHLERAIELDPTRWEWIEICANLYYLEGMYRKAFEYYQKIPINFMRNPESLRQFARLLKRYRGDPKKIRECKRRAREAAKSETFEGFLSSLQEGCERRMDD